MPSQIIRGGRFAGAQAAMANAQKTHSLPPAGSLLTRPVQGVPLPAPVLSHQDTTTIRVGTTSRRVTLPGNTPRGRSGGGFPGAMAPGMVRRS